MQEDHAPGPSRWNATTWCAICALLFLFPACGFGTAGVAAGLSSGGGSGGGNASPSLGGLDVQGLAVAQPKVPPAKVTLVLADAESDPATVQMSLVVPSDPNTEHLLTQLPANPATLSTSAAGVAHDLSWNFSAESALPDDGRYVEGVKVIARVDGGASRELTFGLGNDPPVITQVSLPGLETSGVSPIGFTLADSSDDVVSVEVDYLDESDPGAGWRPATPAGPNPTTPAFPGVEAPRTGIDLVFFWDTEVDLADFDGDVRLRFSPRDPVVAGTPVETAVFTVDNNDTPFVQLQEGPFLLTSDQRRGFPIPYTVFDDEGDPVRVVFQWRPESESEFPPLGTDDPDELAQWIEDPDYVRAKRICEPFPSYARGTLRPVDARRVVLPELQQTGARLLARGGVDGLDLELLRSSVLTGLSNRWKSSPLRAPVAAVPLGVGLTALVLDADVPGQSARLLEIELATGDVVRTVATGIAGGPNALSLTPHQDALVATDAGGTWMIYQVEIETGVVSPVISEGSCVGSYPEGPLRAVVSHGSRAALATAGDALWRLDWIDPAAPRAVRVVRGLATPWGLAHDPHRTGRVWVAERDAPYTPLPAAGAVPIAGGSDPVSSGHEPIVARGRIVSVDVNARTVEPLRGAEPFEFQRPTSLALARGGQRLLVLCDKSGSPMRELRAVSIGVADYRTSPFVPRRHAAYPLGDVGADAVGIASGPEDLLLVTDPAVADLVAGGGVEQKRALTAYDPVAGIATVGSDFAPAPRELQRWRIAHGRSFRDPFSGSPEGTAGAFVWDSRLAADRGRVFVKATSFDAEQGSDARTSSPRSVASRFADRLTISTGSPSDVEVADLEGDGDLDLVCVEGPGIRVFLQEQAGSFAELPLLGGFLFESTVIADLDGDRDLDLATLSRAPGAVGIRMFFQHAPGEFVAQPHVLLGGVPIDLAHGDLDGDGDVDLAAVDLNRKELVVVYQGAPGRFTATSPMALALFPGSVEIADIDSDGRLDLLVAEFDSQGRNARVTRFVQESSGVFTALPPVATGDEPIDFEVADLDADGDLDLVTANQVFSGGAAASSLTVLLQDSAGTFTPLPQLPTGFLSDVECVDLDGNGLLDLVTSDSWPSGTFTVYMQPARGVFDPELSVSLSHEPESVAAGDINGDGVVDLVTVDLDGEVIVHYQGTAPTFAAAKPLSTLEQPLGIAAADLDGDGDLDLAAGGRFGSAVVLYYQEGPREFVAQPPIDVGGAPFAVRAADLEGDGDMDVVVANYDGNVNVVTQEDPGVFATSSIRAGNGPQDVAIADVDCDGDLDLVSANFDGDALRVLLQEAPGVFVRHPPIRTGDGPAAVVAADLEGDGDIDLVSANRNSNDLWVFVQEEPLEWAVRPPIPLPGVSQPEYLATADLDGDGDLDLAAGTASGFLRVYYQDAGQWTAQAPVPEAGYGIAIADVDGDVDLDLVTAGRLGVTVHLQEAPRVFVPQRPMPLKFGTFARVVVADLDGDGDPDLAAIDPAADELTVFWGRQ